MTARIFYPTSSQDHRIELSTGQRYRHPFGDKRLKKRIDILSRRMLEHQSAVINQLSDDKSEKATFYNVLNNDYVELAELIDYNCQICPSVVEGKTLLALLDTSSISLVSRLKEKAKESPTPGVVEDNRTPGFFVHPSLIVDEQAQHVIGLGDIVMFDRPKSHLKGKQARQVRTQRAKLPLKEKESSVWSLCATNTQKRLETAKQVTYVLDQGGDIYATLARLRKDTGADFLVRSKENRVAVNIHTGQQSRLKHLLDRQSWSPTREVAIRGLNFYSKTKSKQVVRQARTAKMKIRFIEVKLCKPVSLANDEITLEDTLTVVEVVEDVSSVPEGEPPIHWRLITTRRLKHIDGAWDIVTCYQVRWFIEQLFRTCKKKGFDIERSQFKNPEAIKRQAIIGVKAATQVLQLTMARSGQNFIPIETVFNKPDEQQVLHKVNQKLSGKTDKTTNPHQPNSLAWAAWVIARLGGWNGYQKSRKPGPITMHRGLKRFHNIIWANNLMNDP